MSWRGQLILKKLLNTLIKKSKIYFAADLHIGHKGILKYCPERPFADSGDIIEHDKYLIGLWKRTVNPSDIVYLVGDLCLLRSEDARKLLETLPGNIHSISGNHDGSLRSHSNYFESVSQIKEIVIKASRSSILNEDLRIVLSHYPMLDWNNKFDGAVMLHGHTHGNLDAFNKESEDLRFDVGIDGELARSCSCSGEYAGLVSLEALCEAILKKTGGLTPSEYAKKTYVSSL